MRIYSFPPIADTQSRILILGTMPGKISLSKQEYYAHPQNAFWKIVFELFEKEFVETYYCKKEFLLKKQVGLWDVLQTCERESSADSDIQEEIVNDFETFFKFHPSITHIFFNGNNPFIYFKRHQKNIPLPFSILPSTSPANAIPFTKKLNAWSVILNHL
jgi:hypoxanthine-DNA glycosylase